MRLFGESKNNLPDVATTSLSQSTKEVAELGVSFESEVHTEATTEI